MVGLLLVTHGEIGAALLRAAERIVPQHEMAIQAIAIPVDLRPDQLGLYVDSVRVALQQLDQGEGVMALTDLFGSTPSNLLAHLLQEHPMRMLTGVNLPMLIRLLNHSHQDLNVLARLAEDGGSRGIRPIQPEEKVHAN